MKITSILLAILIIIVFIYGYYFIVKVSLAIWMPEKSNKKWLDIANNPVIKGSFFIKWITPIFLVMVAAGMIFELARYMRV